VSKLSRLALTQATIMKKMTNPILEPTTLWTSQRRIFGRSAATRKVASRVQTAVLLAQPILGFVIGRLSAPISPNSPEASRQSCVGFVEASRWYTSRSPVAARGPFLSGAAIVNRLRIARRVIASDESVKPSSLVPPMTWHSQRRRGSTGENPGLACKSPRTP